MNTIENKPQQVMRLGWFSVFIAPFVRCCYLNRDWFRTVRATQAALYLLCIFLTSEIL